jgi:protease YdgD
MRWLSLCLIALLSAGPAHSAQIGRDTLMNAEEAKAWRGVGRINIAGYQSRRMCSGTLIAPDIVLTAAHCLMDVRTGRVHKAGKVNFVAGWHKGKMTGHRIGKSVVFHPDWPVGQPLKGILPGPDIALLRLVTPMVPEEAEPFDFADRPRPDTQILLISYRGDRPHALSRQADCRYLSNRGGFLRLDCPVTFGASGAPVFTADGRGIFGVVSAKRRGHSFAAPVAGIVQDLIERLP